ncbi:hypothetical protein C8R43DRAFT_953645 [Mycena crocata]|nr:hypothetical protein C8R43DRAFT_965572 [Mycena crocata]KAJ7145216.1 hypothetical protein C8R43DRAFT_953645 [Mycena crocata]
MAAPRRSLVLSKGGVKRIGNQYLYARSSGRITPDKSNSMVSGSGTGQTCAKSCLPGVEKSNFGSRPSLGVVADRNAAESLVETMKDRRRIGAHADFYRVRRTSKNPILVPQLRHGDVACGHISIYLRMECGFWRLSSMLAPLHGALVTKELQHDAGNGLLQLHVVARRKTIYSVIVVGAAARRVCDWEKVRNVENYFQTRPIPAAGGCSAEHDIYCFRILSKEDWSGWWCDKRKYGRYLRTRAAAQD